VGCERLFEHVARERRTEGIDRRTAEGRLFDGKAGNRKELRDAAGFRRDFRADPVARQKKKSGHGPSP
jgi:hypothetical protein